MKELHELKESSNEVIKQSEELLEHLEVNLESDLELEQIENELVELERQNKQFKRNAKLISIATGLYSLMLLARMIMM